jgi:hypothetical protein
MAQQAQVFKTFINSDVTTTRTLLHESIPITGSMLSGTYAVDSTTYREVNIKAHSHGMFQSVYDYPYLSSSANHIFDITVGATPNAPAPPDYIHTTRFEVTSSIKTTIVNQQDKKLNVYSQMAQILVGYGDSGSIRNFDVDGNFNTGEDKILAPTFLNFSRLLAKDEIKKGSFQLDLGVGPVSNPFKDVIRLADSEATGSYRTNSPAGEYGILMASDVDVASLYTSSLTPVTKLETPLKVGLVYYQAGIVVLNSAALLYASGSPGVEGGPDSNSGSLPLDAEAPSGILNLAVLPAATATITCADGDDNTNGAFSELEIVTITSTDGTVRKYVLVDNSEGSVATGRVLVQGDDYGSSTLGVDHVAIGGIAVSSNLNTHNQATILNEFRAAILHADGHNGKITCSAALTPAHGPQVLTLTQVDSGGAGNVTVTTTISQFTPAGFSGGANFVDFMYTPGSSYDTGSFDLGLVSASIDQMADSWRRRIQNIQFNNTTELNSAVYFCRAHHNEFNYSSNPTYLTGSEIRVKNGDSDIAPHAYITTVGLYSADNELLAVAKVSEPIKKSPENEVTLRVRLDY